MKINDRKCKFEKISIIYTFVNNKGYFDNEKPIFIFEIKSKQVLHQG